MANKKSTKNTKSTKTSTSTKTSKSKQSQPDTVEKAVKKAYKKNPKAVIISIVAIVLVIAIAAAVLYFGFPDTWDEIVSIFNKDGDNGGNSFKPLVRGDGELLVHMLDVGQGDCIYIQLPDGKDMVIDCANYNNSSAYQKETFDYLDAYITDDTVEYLMLTHCDSDHVYFMDDLLDRYQVDNLYMPNVLATPKNEELKNQIAELDTSRFTDKDTIDSVTYAQFFIAALTEPNCTITLNVDKDVVSFSVDFPRTAIKGSEFTFEAGRPDTATYEKLRILRDFGVNRVSINTQTTNDAILCEVGRNHTAHDYFTAFETARRVGFSVINTDLIAGLPGESTESFRKSLCDVLALRPENITVHAFTLKRSSDYTVGGEKISVSDPTVAQMIAFAEEKLHESGYLPYYMYRQKNTGGNFENVGYANAKTAVCRYNIDMMEEFQTILACGAGASSKLVGEDLTAVQKLHNPKYPYEYLKENAYMLKNRDELIRFYRTVSSPN